MEIAVDDFDMAVENTNRAAVVRAAVAPFEDRVRGVKLAGNRDRAAPHNRHPVRNNAHRERQFRARRNVQRPAVVFRVVFRVVNVVAFVRRQLFIRRPTAAHGAVRHMNADDFNVRARDDIEDTAVGTRVDFNAGKVLVVNKTFEFVEAVETVTVDRNIFIDKDFALRQLNLDASPVVAQRRREADRVAVLRLGDGPTERAFDGRPVLVYSVAQFRNAPNRRFLRRRFDFRRGEGGGQVDNRVFVKRRDHFRGDGGVGLRRVIPSRRRQEFAIFELFKTQRSFFQRVFHLSFPYFTAIF